VKRFIMAAISLVSFFVLAAGSLPASASSTSDAQGQAMKAHTARAHAAKTVTTRAQTTGARTSRAASKVYLEDPLCQSYNSLCVDTSGTPAGGYVGHDEPSLEFKSGRAGSGNDMAGLQRWKQSAGRAMIIGNGRLRPAFNRHRREGWQPEQAVCPLPGVRTSMINCYDHL
jgi:hypothetical protein